MGEYASKGLAGSALGLAIPGTVALANQLFSGNGYNGGLLGGLFGNNGYNYGNNQMSALMSENAMLKAENYSDRSVAHLNNATDSKIGNLSDRIFDKYISPIAQEVADARVREATMAAEIKCIKETSELKEKLFNARINEVALISNNGITALQGQINCLAQTVNGITKTVVPITAVCPEPMKLYNSWTAPTTTTTTTG